MDRKAILHALWNCAKTDPLCHAMAVAMQERLRQIEEEGFSPERDLVEHSDGQLGQAAARYLSPEAMYRRVELPEGVSFVFAWPWHTAWFKPGGPGLDGRVRDVTKGAALALAEMERVLRETVADEGDPEGEATLSRGHAAVDADSDSFCWLDRKAGS